MHLPLSLVLLGVSVGAMAQQDFWHPETDEITIAGPDEITYCYNLPSDACPDWYVECAPSWVCGSTPADGARSPITIVFPEIGPVKVMGARWAYARIEGKLEPMVGDDKP